MEVEKLLFFLTEAAEFDVGGVVGTFGGIFVLEVYVLRL